EVDALADQAVLLEDEERQDRELVLPPGGWQAAERTPVGAADDRLDHHAFVCVMESAQLVALVREGTPALLEIARDLLRPVIDVAGGDQLVAGVLEGVEGRVELVAVLRVHVLPDDLLALAAYCGRRRHRGDSISPWSC